MKNAIGNHLNYIFSLVRLRMQNDRRIKNSSDINGDTETLVSGATSGMEGSKASQVIIKQKPYHGMYALCCQWGMDKVQPNIVGQTETNEDYISEDIRVIYAGGQESQRGVAVLLDKETSNGIM